MAHIEKSISSISDLTRLKRDMMMEIDDRDSIMPNKSFNDLSAITLRRDQELVDVKLKF